MFASSETRAALSLFAAVAIGCAHPVGGVESSGLKAQEEITTADTRHPWHRITCRAGQFPGTMACTLDPDFIVYLAERRADGALVKRWFVSEGVEYQREVDYADGRSVVLTRRLGDEWAQPTSEPPPMGTSAHVQ